MDSDSANQIHTLYSVCKLTNLIVITIDDLLLMLQCVQCSTRYFLFTFDMQNIARK